MVSDDVVKKQKTITNIKAFVALAALFNDFLTEILVLTPTLLI